jgi:carboxylesterase type B
MYNFVKPSGAKLPDPGLSDVDRKVSETMMKIWAHFAKTGNSNLKGVVNWPVYQAATDQYLYITAKVLEYSIAVTACSVNICK